MLFFHFYSNFFTPSLNGGGPAKKNHCAPSLPHMSQHQHFSRPPRLHNMYFYSIIAYIVTDFKQFLCFTNKDLFEGVFTGLRPSP